MKKFITDIHTHSTYSFDGISSLKDILARAQSMGVDFYGVSEHADYDVFYRHGTSLHALLDEEEYFHGARHLQEDYEGVMNVLIGIECGYGQDPRVTASNSALIEKYKPDFVVNSVHTINGEDYYDGAIYYKNGVLRDKQEVYNEYLDMIYESLFCAYPYDIVAHIGYATRYAPYADKEMRYVDFVERIDKILRTIIAKGKILEVNASRALAGLLPTEDILRRYFALGGRNISYGSDTHGVDGICKARAEITAYLRGLGFTHITVPCRGEYIKVEL